MSGRVFHERISATSVALAYAIAGLFSSVFSNATEVADIRSWNTLPDNCYFGEIALPQGQHKIEIHYLDRYNNTVKVFKKLVNLNINNKTNLITSYAL